MADNGEKTVNITNAKVIAPGLMVLVFPNDEDTYADIFNVTDEQQEKLLAVEAGKQVSVTITADTEEDADGHPSVVDAAVMGDKATGEGSQE